MHNLSGFSWMTWLQYCTATSLEKQEKRRNIKGTDNLGVSAFDQQVETAQFTYIMYRIAYALSI